jgi:uncharacterized delta-60 repeat protein
MRCTFEPLEPRRLCAAGDQDLTYGDGGFLRLSFGQAAYQFLPGSDPAGSATVVGMSADGASFSVRQFNAGVPDATAGPNGTIATIPLPFDVPAGKRVAPARIWNLSGGRTLIEFLVPATSTSADGFYVRLNADRTLDTTYGNGGVVMVHGGFWLDAVQQGDKLVALREAGGVRPTVARYTDQLELDATFGGDNGIISTGGRPSKIAIQPDNKIVLADRESGHVFRLTADGMFDATFDGDGIAESGDIETVSAIAVDTAGRIVVNGVRTITRLTPTGLPDTTFGTSGRLVPFPATGSSSSDVVLPDGTLLDGTFDDFVHVFRITPGGQYDASFGRAFVNLGMFEPLPDPTVEVIRDPQTSSAQADGSVLVSRRLSDGRFVQVRLEAGGAAPGVVTLNGGVMTVTGSDDDDFIVINPVGRFVGTRQGVGRRFEPGEVTSYSVDAGAGDDAVVVREDDSRPAVIFGGVGDDRIAGSRGDDTLFGNAGNDRIDGHEGHDLIHGNGGRDKLSGDTGIEGASFGPDGNDRLFGGAGGDWLAGGDGDDILDGGVGDDYLDGGAGADRMMGNDGNDTFVSADAGTADPGIDDLYGGGGTDSLLSGDAEDLLTDIETT